MEYSVITVERNALKCWGINARYGSLRSARFITYILHDAPCSSATLQVTGSGPASVVESIKSPPQRDVHWLVDVRMYEFTCNDNGYNW